MDGSPPMRVEPEACEDVFDCPPHVALAFATNYDDFELMTEDSPQPLWFGGDQGGYHFFTGIETHAMCDVLELEFGIDILRPEGGREPVASFSRLPLSVRCEMRPEWFPEGCDGDPSQQRWWPMLVIIPCAFHPEDPNNEADCAEPPAEPITDFEVVMTVSAHDEIGVSSPDPSRVVAHEVQVQPVCCGGE